MPSKQLRREIAKYVGRGYRVAHETESSAQLVKPKKFSFLWFFIWLILGLGIGALIYAGWYMAKRDELVYLSVDAGGRVHANRGRASAARAAAWDAVFEALPARWHVGPVVYDRERTIGRE